jgi:hypothetical protein
MSQFEVAFDDVSLLYEPLEQGVYDFQIVQAAPGLTQKNEPKLEIVFKVCGPPETTQIGKKVTMHLSTKMTSTIGQLVAAAGTYPLPKSLTLEGICSMIFQKVVRGRVEHEAYTDKSGVQKIGARIKEFILNPEIVEAEKARSKSK